MNKQGWSYTNAVDPEIHMDKTNWPKISIVTPNFNGGMYLEETILSVLNQNYLNLEYIIIDGGSSDNSIDIIKKYEHKLFYWISEQDNGLYDAIQKGFEKATGEIMGWINSDDMYYPKAFFTVSEIFQFQEVNWLQGIPTHFDEIGRAVSVMEIRRWSKMNYYLGDFEWIQQESVFWRRNLWEKAGGKMSTTMKYAGDFELWLRFFRYEKLYITTALLGGFRMRSSGQISLNFMDLYLKEVKERIDDEIQNNISKRNKNLVTIIRKYYLLCDTIRMPIFKKIFNKFIIKWKILNVNISPEIRFDRTNQKFYIVNND